MWNLSAFYGVHCAGQEAPIACSLAYAAPEVVSALDAGKRSMVVEPALDVWALGVIAFEMLTRQRVFPSFSATREDIMSQLLGKRLLPWEEGAEGRDDKLVMLRGLKRTVLKCLERDPRGRPSAAGVLAAWGHMFDSVTGKNFSILMKERG
jgi:serine/threonine protein kinase